MGKKVDVIIPAYKPAANFRQLLEKLNRGSVPVQKIIVMNTVVQGFPLDFSEIPNVEVHDVLPEEFDHGKTRDLGVHFSDADYVLLMTQDAYPEDDFLVERLLEAFQTELVVSAYGRQLPRKNAGEIESFTRSFNYPEEGKIKSYADIETMGIKAFFCSNVCCMYDREKYLELGGFIHKTIFNEDMIFAHKVLENGFKIAYVPEAKVIHSHAYTGREQYCRNFDLSISQTDHPEVFQNISSEKEGGAYVKAMAKHLLKVKKPWLIVPFVYQCGMKYLGYRKGKKYKQLDKKTILKYSMNKNYWEE